MLRKLLLPAAAGLALLCASAPAAAQELRSDRATYFTFSAPVALPTITLPAGRYLFRLADSAVTRSVVQVYSEDGSKLHAMLLTLPASRNEVSDEPEVRFLEGRRKRAARHRHVVVSGDEERLGVHLPAGAGDEDRPVVQTAGTDDGEGRLE